MIWLPLFSLMLSTGFAEPSVPVLQSFESITEKDLPLKKKVPIYLQHHLGKVTIQGWVQDRIRVKLKKRVLSANETEAKKELQKLDLITLDSAQNFEIRVGHTHGTDLVTKLKDTQGNQVAVDLEIKAPYQADLVIILEGGKSLDLSQWKGGITVNGKDSEINFSRLMLQKDLLVNCVNCSLNLTESKLKGHLLIGNGGSTKNILLNQVEGNPLLIDTSSAEVRLENTSGQINVHTETGRCNSVDHRGTLTFQSEEGGLFASGLRGNAEAQTQTGQIMIDADEIKNFLHLDSEKSDIQVSLIPKFEGSLDLMSLRGELVVQFVTQSSTLKSGDFYGPVSLGSMNATIGKNTSVSIHAYTKQGGVRILRKIPNR